MTRFVMIEVVAELSCAVPPLVALFGSCAFQVTAPVLLLEADIDTFVCTSRPFRQVAQSTFRFQYNIYVSSRFSPPSLCFKLYASEPWEDRRWMHVRVSNAFLYVLTTVPRSRDVHLAVFRCRETNKCH